LPGDLNCPPDTGVVELLLKGEVASDHPDWEHAKQFVWRDEEEKAAAEADAGDEDEEEGFRGGGREKAESTATGDDDIDPLPKEQWHSGLAAWE